MSSNPLTSIAQAYFKSSTIAENSCDQERKIEVPSGSLNLSNSAKDNALFSAILPHSKMLEEHILQDYDTSLSATGVDDLQLLAGSKNNPTKSVLNKIDYTQTRTGKCIKATMLASPTRKLSTLQDRQAAIKELGKAETGKSIDGILATYKQAEASVLSFYRKEDPLQHPSYQKNISSFYFKWLRLGKWNTSSIALQFKKIIKDCWLHLGVGFWFTFFLVYSFITGRKAFIGVEKVSNTLIWTKIPFSKWLYGLFRNLIFNDMIFPGLGLYSNLHLWREKWHASTTFKFFLVNNFVPLLLTLIFLLLGCFFWYHAIKKFRRYQKTLQYLAHRLFAFQQLIKSGEDTLDYCKRNSNLKLLTPKERAKLDQFLSSNTNEVSQLVKNLKTLPLNQWYYFLRPQGKLLVTYQLLVKEKYAFADLIYALGKLDALRSVALHIKNAQDYSPHNYYSFTTWVTKSDLPVLEQKELWHPLLDANNVVTNELNMHGGQEGLRTMIITGPNGAGKSTYLHAITVNLVLSQVFGIAACLDSRQTIFHKIVTYFDIIQDLTAGLSFFQAKVKGLKSLAEALATCPQGEYIFCMLDEPLSGTAENVSSEAGYGIVKQFHTQCPQALFIIVTHLAKLTELASYQGCENRKVYIEKKDQNITYTYKIVPGISDQNIALDILKKEGLLDAESTDTAK